MPIIYLADKELQNKVTKEIDKASKSDKHILVLKVHDYFVIKNKKILSKGSEKIARINSETILRQAVFFNRKRNKNRKGK